MLRVSLAISGAAVALSLLTYSFGTSCPHTVGVVEVGVAVSLAVAVIATIFRQAVGQRSSAGGQSRGLIQLTALLLLCIPIIVAALYASSNVTSWGLARDVLPYMFFVIPVFFIGMGRYEAEQLVRVIPAFMIFVGVVYSLRFGVYIQENFGSALSFLVGQNDMFASDLVGRSESLSDDALCLPFDSSVFFSAWFLSLIGLDKVVSRGIKNKFQGVVLLALALVPIGALVLISSRAALALLILMIIAFGAKRASAKSLATVGIIVVGVLFLVWPVITVVLDLLVAKQVAVGSNNKFQEVEEIYAALSTAGAGYIITGLGWGAEYYDSAVGRGSSFSHSLISYFFLKAGILGVTLLGVYMWWIVRMLRKVNAFDFGSYGISAYATAGVLFVSLFLQPLYKTPTYGVLLLYILAMYKVLCIRRRELIALEAEPGLG